ncbi:hypothetical protein AB1Y20_019180 [Prymnesium parvum]|uniref:RPA-interacting protein C-terminal domain-containing protein n=1 Tax=Prymnesium parvum TaxID=97485 RepID=A0AB34JTL4_PRYPA
MEAAARRQRRIEALRERCVQHAQQRRQLLLWERRGAPSSKAPDPQLQAIVRAELNSVSSRPSARWTEADEAELQAELGPEGYLELMAATEAELLHELQADLAHLHGAVIDGHVREYESYLEQEQALLCAGAEAAVWMGAESVLCPVCMRGALHFNGAAVVCSRHSSDGAGCPLWLQAQPHPEPLEVLRERMSALLDEHGRGCQAVPRCRMVSAHEQAAGVAACLLLDCTQCGSHAPVV